VHPPAEIGWQSRLDRLSYYVGASAVLVILVYGPFIMAHFPLHLTTPGMLYP